jgi:hypothetical protein
MKTPYSSRAVALSISAGSISKQLRVIGAIIALSFVLAAMPMPARAASLTSTQISSILSLLQAFGADQTTINEVSQVLGGTIQTTGSITINNATSVASQNIVPNTPNQPLGGFTTNFPNDSVSVQSLTFNVAGGSNHLLTNVAIVDQNGTVVAGPVNENNSGMLVFNDVVAFPMGSMTYTLEGMVPSGTPNTTQYQLSTNPSSQWTGVVGKNTRKTISLPNTSVTMSAMTVEGGALTISVSQKGIGPETFTPGTQNALVGQFNLDASQSAEDVRLTGIELSYQTNSANVLSNCAIYNGPTQLTTGLNIQNPNNSGSAATNYPFHFDNSLVIPHGTVLVVALKCNISSTAASGASFSWGLTSNGALNGIGVASGTTITPSVIANSGSTMTIALSNLIVSTDPTSPSYQIVAGGSMGVTIGTFNLRSSGESVNINKIGLQLGSGSPQDLGKVYIYSGSALLGTAVFTGANRNATTTLTSPFVVGTPVVLTIKADISSVGVGQSGIAGDLVEVNVADVVGSGTSSGLNVSSAGGSTYTGGGVRLFKSYPSVSLLSTPASITNGSQSLFKFSITASPSGSISLQQLAFTLAGNITFTNVTLLGFADAALSQPIAGSVAGQVGVTQCNGLGGCAKDVNLVTFQPTSGTGPTGNTPVIPAGSTYYFELMGVGTMPSGVASEAVTLLGDSTYSLGQANISSNFVWSPNDMSVSALSNFDWTNGYGVLGLPSIGLTENHIGTVVSSSQLTSATVQAPQPSGTLSLSGCTIATGSTTCVFTGSWTSTNTPKGVRVTFNPNVGSPFNMYNDGSPSNYTKLTGYWRVGTYSITLYDTATGKVLDTKPITMSPAPATSTTTATTSGSVSSLTPAVNIATVAEGVMLAPFNILVSALANMFVALGV